MDEAQEILSKKLNQMEGRQPRASAHRPSTHRHPQVNECNSEDEHDRSEESDEAKEIRSRRTHKRGRSDRSEPHLHTFGNATSNSKNTTSRLSQNEYLQDQLREDDDEDEDDDQEDVSGLTYDDEEDQESSKNDETFEVDNR